MDAELEGELLRLKHEHDCNILAQYSKYPYDDEYKNVVNGYIRDLFLLSAQNRPMNDYIYDLCYQFYYEYDKYLFQFAHQLWKTRGEIYLDIVQDQVVSLNGFSGQKLLNHIKNYLKKYIKNKDDRAISLICTDLIAKKYIKLIKNMDVGPSKHSTKRIIDKIWGTGAPSPVPPPGCDVNKTFMNSPLYFYDFRSYRHRQFVKLSQPDRHAWTRGTNVQIYSSTYNGWLNATVIQINKHLLTVTYGGDTNNKQQRDRDEYNYHNGLVNGNNLKSNNKDSSSSPSYSTRKVIDRYDDNKIQSSDAFIANRQNLKRKSVVKVYSRTHRVWCHGTIDEIMDINNNNVFKVIYTRKNQKDSKDKLYTKYIYRWSPQLRVQTEMDYQFEIAQKESKYKKGSKVKIWSKSSQKWVNGIIEDTIPQRGLVNVRYGKSEKLIRVNSVALRLYPSKQ